jgi:hypothetical protein
MCSQHEWHTVPQFQPPHWPIFCSDWKESRFFKCTFSFHGITLNWFREIISVTIHSQIYVGDNIIQIVVENLNTTVAKEHLWQFCTVQFSVWLVLLLLEQECTCSADRCHTIPVPFIILHVPQLPVISDATSISICLHLCLNFPHRLYFILFQLNYMALHTTTINNFVDCCSVTPYYKILTYNLHIITHIHILLQNSHHWPLCKSANVCIAWKHCWKIFAGRSCTASLVAVTITAGWNQHPCSYSFKWGNVMWDQVTMESVAKQWPAVGQAQNNVQGHYGVPTASSSCAKAQDIYDELNCVEDEGFPCSGTCLQLFLLGWLLHEQFQMSQKAVQVLHCLLTCPAKVSSFLVMIVISRWLTVTSVADRTESTTFHLLLRSGWEMSHLR